MSIQPDFRVKELSCYPNYFFTPTPMNSLVVEVQFSEAVDGETLQEAVDDTLQRMPYMGDAFVERDGDFYYAENNLPFLVSEGALRALGGPETNWHCIDVTYEDDTVSFSMFHSLCDGMGLNLFIQATLYHYFCRKDGMQYPADGIRAKGTPQLPDEEVDPYSRFYEAEVTDEIKMRLMSLRKECYVLPEMANTLEDHVVTTSVRIKEKEFVEFAHSCGSSPAPTLATLMADTLLAVHPDCEGDIAGFIPISARSALELPNTFKNCTSAARVITNPGEIRTVPFAERAALARETVKRSLDPAYIRTTTNLQRKKFLETQASTSSFAQRYAVYSGDTIITNNSFMIDYVGGLKVNGYEDRLVATRYLAGSPKRRLPITLYLTATAGRFDIAFVRIFESDAYEHAFCDQLASHGIASELGKPRAFVTPENGFVTTLGLMG